MIMQYGKGVKDNFDPLLLPVVPHLRLLYATAGDV